MHGRNLMKLISIYCYSLSLTVVLILMADPAKAHRENFDKMGVVPPRNEMPAPDFTLESLDGNTLSLQDFRGKTILLNFWATWCGPCKDELPAMQRLYEALRKDGVEIVAVSIDRDNKERVKEYIRKYNLTFPVLLDPDQKIRKKYFIMGLPTSYLIGVDGKLKGFVSGAREWDSTISKQMFSTLTN